MIEGKLVRGLGQAADFTQVDWVRRQLIEFAGIDPHPGTVNLSVDDPAHRLRWRQWRGLPGRIMEPPDSAFCNARCYPVRIAGRLPAAIVLPEVPDYPEDKLELVAAIPVRAHLGSGEGDTLRVDLCRPFPARAVLFDLDGTLVDSVAAYHEVARVAAEPHGLEVTREHVRRSLATGANFWKGVVSEDHPDRDALRKKLSEHASREWPRVLREHGTVFKGMRQTLESLHRAGMRLGIVSGARAEVLELLRAEGVLELFDVVILGSDVSQRKPHPEGILACLKRMGVAAGSAAYVGDTPVDIAASRAAGVHAIGVLTGAADSAMLSMCEPDRLIYSHAALGEIMEAAKAV